MADTLGHNTTERDFNLTTTILTTPGGLRTERQTKKLHL